MLYVGLFRRLVSAGPNGRRRPRRQEPGSPALGLCVGLVALVWPGCTAEPLNRIELTTTDESGTIGRHPADFLWASYVRSPAGTVELVLRTEQPSTIDPTQTITQIVYVKEIWNPRPGTTYAEATQINAHLQYAILTPPTGVRYDGSAFVTYRIDRWTGTMTGKIESGQCAPTSRMGQAVEPFGPARITGTFRAVENPREVVRIAQLLETQFNPRRPAAAPQR